MRICFVIGAMRFSGAEKVLSLVAKELCELQHQVHIVLLNKPREEKEEQDGIYLYGAKATGNKLKRLANRWQNIRNRIQEIQPDVVVSFGYVCNVNTVMAMRGCRTPLVLCERNDPEYDPRKKTEKLSRKLLYPLAQGYVFQTECIRSYFPSYIQKRGTVIPNPIVDTGVRWDERVIQKRIVTVARLDDFQKNQSTLIRAFAEFSHNHPEYILEFYGDGPDAKEYAAQIERLGMQKNIKLMGRCEQIPQAIQTATAFVLSSKFEGMPNALMEAMAMGLPCISTDCGGGGAKALYDYDQGCLLIPQDDETALVAAIECVVNSPERRRELSSRGSRLLEHLQLRKVTKEWEQYLQSITE